MTRSRYTIDRATALVLAWSGTLAMLLAATLRLWTPWRGTPRLAPFSALDGVPPAIDFVLLAMVAYGLLRPLLLAAFTSEWTGSARRESWEGSEYSQQSHGSRRGLPGYRRGVVTVTLALSTLMLLDQLRWQPWAYHAALAGVILATSTLAQALRLLRVVAIAVYAYSAVAKLDAEFAATLGQQMLSVIGLDLTSWSNAGRAALALGFPLVELGIAGLLIASLWARRFRKASCIAVVAMHTATILVLGPWALGHSLGVLLWNVGFGAQTVVLFWPPVEEADEPVAKASLLALAACGLAVIAPALTPLGLWDQWPGWALYAPRGERATLFVHTASVERLPTSLQPHIDAPADGPWRRVRLNEWAIAETGAPLYPQNRIVAAMAIGLLERYPLTGRLRVVVEMAAAPLSRKRRLAELTETATITDAAYLGYFRPGIAWTH